MIRVGVRLPREYDDHVATDHGEECRAEKRRGDQPLREEPDSPRDGLPSPFLVDPRDLGLRGENGKAEEPLQENVDARGDVEERYRGHRKHRGHDEAVDVGEGERDDAETDRTPPVRKEARNDDPGRGGARRRGEPPRLPHEHGDTGGEHGEVQHEHRREEELDREPPPFDDHVRRERGEVHELEEHLHPHLAEAVEGPVEEHLEGEGHRR